MNEAASLTCLRPTGTHVFGPQLATPSSSRWPLRQRSRRPRPPLSTLSLWSPVHGGPGRAVNGPAMLSAALILQRPVLSGCQSCHQDNDFQVLCGPPGQPRHHLSYLQDLPGCGREESLLVQMGHAAPGTGGPGFLGLILFFKKRHRNYENITVLVMAAVRAWQRPVPHEYPPGPNLLLEEGATEKRGFQGW